MEAILEMGIFFEAFITNLYYSHRDSKSRCELILFFII